MVIIIIVKPTVRKRIYTCNNILVYLRVPVTPVVRVDVHSILGNYIPSRPNKLAT